MSDDKKSELIAEYQILQGAITAASQVIIQVLGFSIAAIVALRQRISYSRICLSSVASSY